MANTPPVPVHVHVGVQPSLCGRIADGVARRRRDPSAPRTYDVLITLRMGDFMTVTDRISDVPLVEVHQLTRDRLKEIAQALSLDSAAVVSAATN